MTSIIFRSLYFFIFIFLPYIVPIGIFGYGSSVFFRQEKYIGAGIFLILALVFLAVLLRRRFPLSIKQIDWLKTHGIKITTEFTTLERRWNIRINGEPPFVIYSRANGRVFKSEVLWPSEPDDTFYINDGPARTLETLRKRDPYVIYLIPVYVNPAKTKQYYMDLSAMEATFTD